MLDNAFCRFISEAIPCTVFSNIVPEEVASDVQVLDMAAADSEAAAETNEGGGAHGILMK